MSDDAEAQSLSQAMLARRSEYTQQETLRIKVGTWNIAACPGTEYDLANWFVEPSEPDIYVLGLQEVVDLASTREYIGGRTDGSIVEKWRKAVEAGILQKHKVVAEQQLVGLLLLIYAAPHISITNVNTITVGTGIWGYLGNKGAVVTELMVGETTKLAFVNCHLSSGADPAALERRCWDVSQIVARSSFIDESDAAFWFGDLNFRLTGLPGADIRRLLELHARGEYSLKGGQHEELAEEPVVVNATNVTNATNATQDELSDESLPDPEAFDIDPHADPSSLQSTLDSLVTHDELLQVRKSEKALNDGWREGPLTFLPTYKYDIGSISLFDSSDKQRAPSWCDRIIYRTKHDKTQHDKKVEEQKRAREKDAEMESRGLQQAADDESVLFDYDPDADGEGEYEEYVEEEQEEAVEELLHLELYKSHQRVTSSDHKPLSAVFSLKYDAVVPKLKAKIQQEVARELDRAENESRPGITIVVESQENNDGVDFGDVGYLRRTTRYMTVANTGRVPATFTFAKRPGMDNTEEIAPKWLKIFLTEPSENEQDPHASSNITLEPGDTIGLSLEVFIDNIDLVKELNKTRKLDDVLILRVVDGKDHFLRLIGTWLQTCFGMSVDELIRIPEGGARNHKPGDVCWSAPRELFKLTEAVESLTDRVFADSQMLDIRPPQVTGWPFDKDIWEADRETLRGGVIDALEQDQSITNAFPPELSTMRKLEVVSEVLILFLSSLSDGIVPEVLWAQLDAEMKLKGKALEEDKQWVLDLMTSAPNHNISLVFLTAMLGKVATELTPLLLRTTPDRQSMNLRRTLSFRKEPPQRDDVNKRYAEIFAPIIFRLPGAKDKDRKGAEDRARGILEVFLRGNTHN